MIILINLIVLAHMWKYSETRIIQPQLLKYGVASTHIVGLFCVCYMFVNVVNKHNKPNKSNAIKHNCDTTKCR